MSSTSYIQLAPSNHPSNSTISYRDGNPVINFILGEQDRFLIGSSVRLVGNISVYKTSDGAGFGNIPLVTNDLNKVSNTLSAFSSLLTPQGKYLFDFIIVKHKHGYFLDCEINQIDDLINKLEMYKLNSKIEILNLMYME